VRILCQRLDPRFRNSDPLVAYTHHTLEQQEWLRKSYANAHSEYFAALSPVRKADIERFIQHHQAGTAIVREMDDITKTSLNKVEQLIAVLRRMENPLGANAAEKKMQFRYLQSLHIQFGAFSFNYTLNPDIRRDATYLKFAGSNWVYLFVSNLTR
jgi:hypothetical protein